MTGKDGSLDMHIEAAATEAREFLARVEAVRKGITRRELSDGFVYHDISPKLTGALRRQSMELTRALARMRKP